MNLISDSHNFWTVLSGLLSIGEASVRNFCEAKLNRRPKLTWQFDGHHFQEKGIANVKLRNKDWCLHLSPEEEANLCDMELYVFFSHLVDIFLVPFDIIQISTVHYREMIN